MASARKKAPASNPSKATVEQATRQALAKLRCEHPNRQDHEDLAQEALSYCLGSFGGDSAAFAGNVAWKACRLALDAIRRERPKARRALERPQTLNGLREAVRSECRRRVREATKEDIEDFASETRAKVEREGKQVRAARDILGALERAPWLGRHVDQCALGQARGLQPTWHELLAMRVLAVGYFDGTGGYRRFGETDTEQAVLSLLSGSWPEVQVGTMTVAGVIRAEAAAIRAARRRSRWPSLAKSRKPSRTG
ncbi:MAG: hypothetical protein IPM35_04270 [Myxococcales bacterium]|nr:hypothetical protein [Myxococcales bacterium]